MEDAVRLKAGRRGRESGFTLIEVVVALAILAVTVSLVMGSGVQLAERWGEQAQLQSVVRQVGTLKREAFLKGASLIWNAEPPASVSLPAGWQARADEGIEFLPTGFCTGGTVTIVTSTNRRHVLSLAAPECDPVPFGESPRQGVAPQWEQGD